ncbi:unnamed protein product [Moneuplotes crassus]|uniref:BTB domain-containing protein n=1 Tax=Euplotes crassus TaxID=5936 RepID=A0AAD1Y9V6_EUPCR|nr:unnamed protein product [Moneuplotes crassus]
MGPNSPKVITKVSKLNPFFDSKAHNHQRSAKKERYFKKKMNLIRSIIKTPEKEKKLTKLHYTRNMKILSNSRTRDSTFKNKANVLPLNNLKMRVMDGESLFPQEQVNCGVPKIHYATSLKSVSPGKTPGKELNELHHRRNKEFSFFDTRFRFNLAKLGSRKYRHTRIVEEKALGLIKRNVQINSEFSPDKNRSWRRRLEKRSQLNSPKIIKSKRNSELTDETAGLSFSQAEIKKDVTIHVKDYHSEVKKDFQVDKQFLMDNMLYFHKYFEKEKCKNTQKRLMILDDLDITIQCSPTIFRWILGYLRNKQTPVYFNPEEVIPILISSDSLMIPKITKEALDYICNNLQRVVDKTSCSTYLRPHLMKKISRLIPIKKLDSIQYRKGTGFINKIYKYKLETLHLGLNYSYAKLTDRNYDFNSKDNILRRCKYCDKMYTDVGLDLTPCHNSHHYINVYGELIPPHKPLSKWDLNDFASRVRKKESDWKTIYYRVWAFCILLRCTECNQAFRLYDYDQCRYHPQKFCSDSDVNKGIYKCCGLQQDKFSIIRSTPTHGCCMKQHKVDQAPEVQNILNRFEANKTLIFADVDAKENRKKIINDFGINLNQSKNPYNNSTEEFSTIYSKTDKSIEPTLSDVSQGDLNKDVPKISDFEKLPFSAVNKRNLKRPTRKSVSKRYARLQNLREQDSMKMLDLCSQIRSFRSSERF